MNYQQNCVFNLKSERRSIKFTEVFQKSSGLIVFLIDYLSLVSDGDFRIQLMQDLNSNQFKFKILIVSYVTIKQ